MKEYSLKSIIYNFILNFFSYALPTVVLQFVVQPIIANRLGSELNGQYLTLMSLNYFMVAVTATVLNTVRMLQNEKYEREGVVGDFSIYFWGYALFLIVFMPVGFVFFTKSLVVTDIVLYVIIALLYLYHDYIFAQYRLRLQFNRILINNCILIAGYAIGLYIFVYWYTKWQIVVIAAYLLGAIYDYFNTTYIREPLRRTPFFNSTSKKIGSLTCANALSSSMTYCDKLLLYPLLGGSSVSVYNTASLVGKMLILVSAPLNSFALSYLVKVENLEARISRKQIVGIIGLLIALYAGCVAIGYPLTDFLYPKWAKESQVFIPITVAASMFTLIGNLLNTVVIRFYKTSFQIIIQGINLIIYLVICLSFLHVGHLLGFSIGVATVACIKMVVLTIIIVKGIKKKSSNT